MWNYDPARGQQILDQEAKAAQAVAAPQYDRTAGAALARQYGYGDLFSGIGGDGSLKAAFADPAYQALVSKPTSVADKWFAKNPWDYGEFITRWRQGGRGWAPYTVEEFISAQDPNAGFGAELGARFLREQSPEAQDARAPHRANFILGGLRDFARGLAPLAAAAGAYGLTGIATGALGGAAGGAATGASSMPAAGGVGGASSSAIPGWAAGQAGTTFSTTMPWAAQLAEGASLAGAGLTAAEAQALGLNGLAAWGGQGINALQNFGINPTSITGSGATKGAGNMGWLDTLLNVGGNLASGYMQARAAGKAADTQAQSASDANAMLAAMYAQNRADAEPWRQAGMNALGNLANAGTAYQKSPGYQFRLGEGNKAINNAATARGGYDSGATLKALTRYGQDYASNDFGNWWNQQAGLAGVGQTAVGQIGQYGMGTAAQQAQNVTGAGNARASGYVGQGNAWNNAIGNTLGYYNQSNALAQMLPYLNRRV